MLTHRSAATSAGRDPSDYLEVDIGNNRRTAPWWKEGPVDSCCCGCSLRMGVGILAMLDILVVPVIFFIIFGLVAARKASEAVLSDMQDEFAKNCGETRTEAELQCEGMAGFIKLHTVDNAEIVPLSLYLRGAFFLIAGVVGSWAVFGSNATAAKLYLWTWATRLLLAVVNIISIVLGNGHFTLRVLFLLLGMVIFLITLYFFKVVWSYHEVLKRRTLGSPQSAVRDVELNVSYSAGEADSSVNLV